MIITQEQIASAYAIVAICELNKIEAILDDVISKLEANDMNRT